MFWFYSKALSTTTHAFESLPYNKRVGIAYTLYTISTRVTYLYACHMIIMTKMNRLTIVKIYKTNKIMIILSSAIIFIDESSILKLKKLESLSRLTYGDLCAPQFLVFYILLTVTYINYILYIRYINTSYISNRSTTIFSVSIHKACCLH